MSGKKATPDTSLQEIQLLINFFRCFNVFYGKKAAYKIIFSSYYYLIAISIHCRFNAQLDCMGWTTIKTGNPVLKYCGKQFVILGIIFYSDSNQRHFAILLIKSFNCGTVCVSAYFLWSKTFLNASKILIFSCILCTNKVLVIAIKYSHYFHIFLIRS